jgi:hypothetical protein
LTPNTFNFSGANGSTLLIGLGCWSNKVDWHRKLHNESRIGYRLWSPHHNLLAWGWLVPSRYVVH